VTAGELLPLSVVGAGDDDGDGDGDRVVRDRLELVAALIGAPSFDPLYRTGLIRFPRDHPVYRWGCAVEGCQRARIGSGDVCDEHRGQWRTAQADGIGKAAFMSDATGLNPTMWPGQTACRVCPQRPAAHLPSGLCKRHRLRWERHAGAAGQSAGFERWLTEQQQFAGYGACRVAVCPDLADTPLGLCDRHEERYRSQGRPGGALLPASWWHRFESRDLAVRVGYGDREQFEAWCAQAAAACRPGQVNLHGLAPLLRAEIQWSLFILAAQTRPREREPRLIQQVAEHCRARGAVSLVDLDLDDIPSCYVALVREMLLHLRLIYITPADSREAGFIETEHFGMRFPRRASRVELTEVTQRWLRDLLWDQLAESMRSVDCPRTAGWLDDLRRACLELSAFLELNAPGGGHDAGALRAEHAQQFVADQRNRELNGRPALRIQDRSGGPSVVTATLRCRILNGVRKLLRDAMDGGLTDLIGLDRRFITAIPAARGRRAKARRPFPDDVARALAEEDNLGELAAAYDPEDQGMRDIWETLVSTGRRVNEVLKLRLECVGRYGGLPLLWHDQAKVGNLDVAIRIPERLFTILTERQGKTVDRYTARHGSVPAGTQRAELALFPSRMRNRDGTASLGYDWFASRFRSWVDTLDLGHLVPHQARHTLATNLLRSGATLAHVRRYLGHVSDRMAEHYIHLSSTDLEDVLNRVWVAGPGAASPGELLSPGTPMTAGHAQALAIDLSRRSTPAEGGFCTFQPVVDGGACPWKLNCHGCGEFVMSGADLLYWRRKREQWSSIAERSPDDATADYLHQVFAPTAAAIDGLEGALAALGLLEQALAVDLRRPQDYYQRIWNLGFAAADLTAATTDTDAPGDAPAAGPVTGVGAGQVDTACGREEAP